VRKNTQVVLPKLGPLDRDCAEMRAHHYIWRMGEAYVAWIKRYMFFVHAKRHPAVMGAEVAASTQNQALRALLFLYRDVLEVDLPWLDGSCAPSRRSGCWSSRRAT
jgi:hypothetical protein